MYFISSLDKLEISVNLNPKPVNITSDFGNNTYYSDVSISLASKNFKGSFKLEYYPGEYMY